MRMAPVREQQAGFAPVGEQQREDGEDATTRAEKIVGSSQPETLWRVGGERKDWGGFAKKKTSF